MMAGKRGKKGRESSILRADVLRCNGTYKELQQSRKLHDVIQAAEVTPHGSDRTLKVMTTCCFCNV